MILTILVTVYFFYRLNFSTPMSTNAVSICKSIGLSKVTRIEASIRYLICFHGDKPSCDTEDRLVQCLHDRMTQCRYLKPVQTFDLDVQSEPVYEVNVMDEGRSALEKANKDLGDLPLIFLIPHKVL